MEKPQQIDTINAVPRYSDKRALVVEDLDSMRIATVEMLLALGFQQVSSVSHGKQALAAMQDSHFDVIVSDWMMPTMNGFDLLQQVRSQPQSKDIVFIMCSVVVDQGLVRQAIAAGVSEYLVKPFSSAMLGDCLFKAFTHPLHQRMPCASKMEVRPQAALTKSVSAWQAGDNKRQILIVDDVADNIQVIAEIIKPLAKVRAVTSGQGALKICASAMPPDLILLDVMMPDMDGYKVIAELKNNPHSRDIPVIFLTAKSAVQDITRGFDLGAVDYVAKPVQPAVLVARINNQLRILDYQNSLRAQTATLLQNMRLREDIERVVRHDLNNPLTAIIGAAEQINRQAGESSLLQQNSELIMQSAMMIHRMLSNLSMLSKLEDPSFRPDSKPLALLDIIQQVVSSFPKEVAAKALHVSVSLSAQTWVVGDESMLYSLFANLCKNAIDAAPLGSTVEIYQQEDVAKVKIIVANLGAVAKEIRANFFNKYVTKGKVHGSGLGTYSASLISKALGGDIALEASEQDTKLIVTLVKATPVTRVAMPSGQFDD